MFLLLLAFAVQLKTLWFADEHDSTNIPNPVARPCEGEIMLTIGARAKSLLYSDALFMLT